MKNKFVMEFFCGLLVLLFAYTGLSKLLTFSFYLADLKESPILGNYSELIAYTIPALEIIIAVGILIPKTRLASLYAYLAMIIGFTVYLVYMLAFSEHRPCTCGGVIREMSWPAHLMLNAVLILMSIITIRWEKQQQKNKHTENVTPIDMMGLTKY